MISTKQEIEDYVLYNFTSEELCELVSGSDLATLWYYLKGLVHSDYTDQIEYLIHDFRIKNGYEEHEDIDFKRDFYDINREV